MNQLLEIIASLYPVSEPSHQRGNAKPEDEAKSATEYLQLGDEQWPEYKSEAYRCYVHAAQLARASETWEVESSIYHRIYERLVSDEQYTELVELSKITALRAQENEDWTTAAQFTLWGVFARFREKKRLEMIPPLQAAIHYLEKIDDVTVAIDLLNIYMDVCLISGLFTEVIVHSATYLSFLNQAGQPEDKIQHLQRIIVCHIGLGQHEIAREAAEHMLELSNQQPLPETTIKALNLLSTIEVALGV